jgi:hypothetical protein
MQSETFQTPVALIVFNRPKTTRKVFDAIAEIRPSRLLIVADGPRPDRAGEDELCAQVREVVQAVNWPCEVLTNFAGRNLGCQERVVSGLDWVFSQVEEAIILEDDCLPGSSFFAFCEELLNRYRGDSRVAAISGTNFLEKYFKSEDSYYFSRLGGVWGWATWRSEWQRYDRHLKHWPYHRDEGTLSEIFSDPRAVAYWTQVFDKMYDKSGPNTWDYQWLYTHLVNHSVTAVPKVNLVTNIGFGTDATHTSQADPRLIVPSRTIVFPLRHPYGMIPLWSMDRRLQRLYSLPLGQRVTRKIHRLAAGVVRSFRNQNAVPGGTSVPPRESGQGKQVGPGDLE